MKKGEKGKKVKKGEKSGKMKKGKKRKKCEKGEKTWLRFETAACQGGADAGKIRNATSNQQIKYRSIPFLFTLDRGRGNSCNAANNFPQLA